MSASPGYHRHFRHIVFVAGNFEVISNPTEFIKIENQSSFEIGIQATFMVSQKDK